MHRFAPVGLAVVVAACNAGNSGEFSIEVTFTNGFGEPFVDAALATSEGDELFDVAQTDLSGQATLRAHRGALVTGYVPDSYALGSVRVSTTVESDHPLVLREFRSRAAQVPFEVTGLAPGDSVSVLDLAGGVSGYADSAGEFAGVAWGEREHDGAITLVASDNFDSPTKWGAATNVPDGGTATMMLTTSYSAVDPDFVVDVRSVSETAFVSVLPGWQGATLFHPDHFVTTTSAALLSFRVLGRDRADTVRVSGQDGSHGTISRTLAWPHTDPVVLDLAPPGFSIDATVSTSGSLTLSVSGTADALVGYLSDGDSLWEFILPRDGIPDVLTPLRFRRP